MNQRAFQAYSGLPTANIAVKRNKIKVYPGNQVFLQDKQEFEIELFNPTGATKLAKISMNGKLISAAGIVLKPGQRVYLERFLDTPQKFKFETYTVDNSSAAQNAIANNGDIQVDFYDEYVPVINYFNSPSITYTNTTGGNPLNPSFSTCTSGIMGFAGASGDMQMKCSSTSAKKSMLRSLKQSEVETGRVEKGGNSNQNFTNYSGQFNTYTSSTVRIKILPLSQKPIEVSDLAVYCTNCGTKNKKGLHKYCPHCGTKFE